MERHLERDNRKNILIVYEIYPHTHIFIAGEACVVINNKNIGVEVYLI
jgi:hypothetical protein